MRKGKDLSNRCRAVGGYCIALVAIAAFGAASLADSFRDAGTGERSPPATALTAGVRAYLNRNYVEAVRLLEGPLAAGNSDAAVRPL